MKYGDVLILGIIGAPVYLMLAGWAFGRPRNLGPVLLGVSYLTGITVMMWGGLWLFTVLLGVVFY
jgi:hypothetical protein